MRALPDSAQAAGEGCGCTLRQGGFRASLTTSSNLQPLQPGLTQKETGRGKTQTINGLLLLTTPQLLSLMVNDTI